MAPAGGEVFMMAGKKQRRELHYRGHVQGVGFLYTVRDIARRYEVAGFVRNLPDGRVHLIAEGTADELDALLADPGQRSCFCFAPAGHTESCSAAVAGRISQR